MDWTQHTETLKADFDREGYVALRGFLDPGEVAAMNEQMARFHREVMPSLSAEEVFYEDRDDPTTLKQIQRLHEHDAYFGQWMSDSKFRRVAELLLGEAVTCQNMQYFNKPARVGKATPPHQDGYYFMLEPCAAVTMWLALEKVDEVNGCVRYVSGSHRLGLRAHGRSRTLGFSQCIMDYPCPYDNEHERPLPAEPGDLLVHHALTIHRAEGNRSTDRSRRAMGLIYYAASAEPDQQRHAEYQRRLKQEMAAAGQI